MTDWIADRLLALSSLLNGWAIASKDAALRLLNGRRRK